MKFLRAYISVLIIALLLLISGCGKREIAPTGKLTIVTTVGMVTDLVQRVAGDDAEVIPLMGPGVDPHLYKASYQDVAKLDKADIIFYSGLHLEGKMTDVLEKMARNKPVIAVAEAVPESLRRSPPEFKSHYDPHVWMDPSLWAYTLIPIAAELGKARPDHAVLYRARADSLAEEFHHLYKWAKMELASVPPERRVLITAHDAFGYFGRAFDVEVKGLQGISTATEFGLADMTDLVDLISSRGIKAVFVESSVPRKPLEAVLEGCKSRGHHVVIGGELFSDAMGEPGADDGTYIGMIRHNVTTIAQALR